MNILIYNASGHGTSLLAHTFRMCGMDYGEDTFGWTDAFYHHLERSDVEAALQDKNKGYIRKVLVSYNKGNRPFCGMKLTHFKEVNWKYLKPIFDDFWPNCIKFLTIRHPCELELRDKLRGVPTHSYNETDILKVLTLQLKLMKEDGFKCVRYPLDWDTGFIKKTIEKIGLTWNDDIFDLNLPVNYEHAINTAFYVKDKPTRATGEERLLFESNNPEICDKYVEILMERKNG